jgi:hypothetical protein
MSYGLMSSHLHFGMIAGEDPLASWVRRVHSPFADEINRGRGRIGAVFVRGPKAYPVAVHKAGALLAYIHNNPVRAGVVETASESSWTSHRAYVELERSPRWLNVETGLALAGVPRASFDAWVNDADRRNIRREDVHPDAETEPDPETVGEAAARVDVATIVALTAQEAGIALSRLLSRRGQPESLARAVAVSCADAVGLSTVEIADGLELSESGVTYIRRSRSARPDIIATSERILERLGMIVAGGAARVRAGTGT